MKVQKIAPGAYFVQSYTTQGMETSVSAEDDNDVEIVGVQTEQPNERRNKVPNDFVDELMSALYCDEPLTREYIKIALQDIALFDAKQHDYGSENIAAFGERGVVVRMNDKMARIRRLAWDEIPLKNEALEDSYADTSVYGVIARMCRAGVWPGTDNPKSNPPNTCQCSGVVPLISH